MENFPFYCTKHFSFVYKPSHSSVDFSFTLKYSYCEDLWILKKVVFIYNIKIYLEKKSQIVMARKTFVLKTMRNITVFKELVHLLDLTSLNVQKAVLRFHLVV